MWFAIMDLDEYPGNYTAKITFPDPGTNNHSMDDLPNHNDVYKFNSDMIAFHAFPIS